MAGTSADDQGVRLRPGPQREADGSPQLPLQWLDSAVRAAAEEARRVAPRRAASDAHRDDSARAGESGMLLKVPEVARILQIGRRQAWELVWRGELPAVRIGQRSIRVTRADLDRYIERHRGPYGA